MQLVLDKILPKMSEVPTCPTCRTYLLKMLKSIWSILDVNFKRMSTENLSGISTAKNRHLENRVHVSK